MALRKAALPSANASGTPLWQFVFALAVALASFPWFRFELWILETSVMHFVILGTLARFFMPGARAANKAWLVFVFGLLGFILLNALPVTGQPTVFQGALKFTTRIGFCLVTGVGIIGLVATDRSFPERFLRHLSSAVLVIGLGLFVYSFVLLGDSFINVSPGFQQGSDINRNQSGFAFALVAVAATGLAVMRPSWGGGLKAAALIALTVLSGSRGGAIAAAAGVLVVIVLLTRRRGSVAVVAGLLALAFSLSGVMPDAIRSRFVDLVRAVPGAFSYRDEFTQIAFVSALPDSPIVGHGTGTAMDYLGRFHGMWRGVDAHSDISLLAIEGGLIGIGLYFGSIIAVVLVGWAAWQRDKEARPLVGVSLGLLAMVVVHGFGETQMDLLQVWMVFGLVLGVGTQQFESQWHLHHDRIG